MVNWTDGHDARHKFGQEGGGSGRVDVVSDAKISTADAATTVPQSLGFSAVADGNPSGVIDVTGNFFQFDPSLGTLTDVTFDLISGLTILGMGSAAAVTVNSTILFSQAVSR